MNEDSVLRNRLLLDERYVRNLAKKIQKWILTLHSESDLELLKNEYITMLCEIQAYRTTVQRHYLIHRTNDHEISMYNERVEEIAVTVEKTREDIVGLKQELIEAQKERDNKLEYDKVAQDILKLRTRDEYHELITKLQSDIEWLKQEKEQKELGIAARKSKFEAVAGAAKELQSYLETERDQGRKVRDVLRNMDPHYAASDDEDEASALEPPVEEEEAPDSAASHSRFQERDDEDDEYADDEEGIVMDEDESTVNNNA